MRYQSMDKYKRLISELGQHFSKIFVQSTVLYRFFLREHSRNVKQSENIVRKDENMADIQTRYRYPVPGNLLRKNVNRNERKIKTMPYRLPVLL
jgi:hypothetical protein